MKGLIINEEELKERGWEFSRNFKPNVLIFTRGKDKIKWDKKSRVVIQLYNHEDPSSIYF